VRQPVLAVGDKIDHYCVTGVLGQGGMGEVYQARDERLGRLVALKLLRIGQAELGDRRIRFLQEARAASALNHPNIVTVYELGSGRGRDYIAMEYIAGRSLAAILAGERLPIETILDYATQLASAMEAAHSAGIVHRDLKPGNIMVTLSEQIKVVDFGLAKLTEPLAGDPSAPTVSMAPAPQTELGTVLGTIAYMSPEQVEARPVDARSDIFSFGLVLYEMTTGRQAFGGSSRMGTVAAIIRDQPAPVKQLRPETPDPLLEAIRRCLPKQASERIQSMTEIRALLSGRAPTTASSPASVRLPAPVPVRIGPIRWLLIGAALLVVAVGAWFLRPRRSVDQNPPRLESLTAFPGAEQFPALSPSGNVVAFIWNGGAPGAAHVYLKQIGPTRPVQLTSASDDDSHPAWSSDETLVAFHRGGAPGTRGFYVIAALGGKERKVADGADEPRPLTWTTDGQHLAVSDTLDEQGRPGRLRLYLISVATGVRRALTFPPIRVMGDDNPAYSPNGKLLAFVRNQTSNVEDVYVMPAAGGEPRRLTFDNRGVWGLAWTSDGREVIFSSRRQGFDRLWRIPATGGSPELIPAAGEDAQYPSVSRKGNRLVYSRATIDTDIWRVGLTEEGKAAGAPAKFIASTRIDTAAEYSPDGSRVVFYSNRSGSAELWVADAGGQNPFQLTSRGGKEQNYPRWSPDGQWIAYASPASGNWEVYRVSLNGGNPQQLTSEAADDYRPSWSRDGQWIYFASTRDGQDNLWKIPAAGGPPVQVTHRGALNGEESPDGKFLYFTRGQAVWRMPMGSEAAAEKLFASGQAGLWGSWTLGPKGIYYPESSGEKGSLKLFRFETGAIEVVVELQKPVRRTGRRLAVSPDGRTLLFEQLEERASDLMLLSNFR